MLSNVLNNEEFQKRAYQMGLVLDPKGLDETEALISKETEIIYKILTEGGLVKVPKK